MKQDRKSGWSVFIRQSGPAAVVLAIAVVLVVAAITTQSDNPDAQAKPVNALNRPAEAPDTPPKVRLAADANRAFQQKKWDLAIPLYERYVRENPGQAMAWFRLGYCLHITRQYDRALAAYQRALDMPRLKPITYYNISCAYALKNMKKESLENLRRSIDAGFRSTRPIVEDPDFAAYLDDPEFRKLAVLAASKTDKKGYRQFDFWIGKWDVHNSQGQKVGVNEITQSENGFLLTEKWNSAERISSGTSINYYDPRTMKWNQICVDADGGIIRYSGSFQGGRMQFTGDFFDRNGKHGISRATYEPLKDGRVHQLIQRSTDGGKTWTVYFSGYYTRQYSTL